MRGNSDVLRSLKKYLSLGLDHLADLFEFGMDRGRPRRMPLYVYGDAAFNSPSEQREPHDFARVTDVSKTAPVEA